MKRRILAGLLAGAMIGMMAGCQAAQAVPETEATRYQVVDAEEGEALRPSPHTPEYPAIDDQTALSGSLSIQETAVRNASGQPDEIRAVWISYLEMKHLLEGKSESQFTANIGGAFDNIRDYGLNTVIVQVRPFGDALYDSAYFPWSYTITGTEGKDPGFDPLAVMVAEAKNRGLRIEAWVNPYRVRAKGNDNALSGDNKARQWLESDKRSVVDYNGTISYNPASTDARNLIVNGVVEIVRNYAVDGVHIDDYFYPTTDTAFDKSYYDDYRDGGGSLSLADWRRSNVEKLIKRIYAAVKKENPNVLFGISPQSSVDNNYNAQYLDVEKIAGNAGYCDYICPQIYFGYENDAQPYLQTLNRWSDMVKNSPVQLYVGIATYKVGATDSFAGSGKSEWLQNTDRMKRMVSDARKSGSYQGFALYRYDSVFSPATAVRGSVQKENANLKSILN